MTSHFFNHPIVDLHYYRFGTGPQKMLCFHGYGMHGRQFKVLEHEFGDTYTFYGFDLFFHKQTAIRDLSLANLKRGITKAEFCELMLAFCKQEAINDFSMMAYSLGTNYAIIMAESRQFKIDTVFLIAPAFLKIPPIVKVLAKNGLANFCFRKLFLSENGVGALLNVAKAIGIVDAQGYEILKAELATKELRFTFYATVTYLRHTQPNLKDLVQVLNEQNRKTVFIFGKRDQLFPQHIADNLIAKLNTTKKVILDEDHDLVNANLANHLHQFIYDHQS